ncbi:ArsR/SmtB family transcription factor [Mesorhizobium erdmanii]|uniref:ArsR family transcriptional regulator n=1 Tax=Mesorhizobium erdmanii TaxID=1777866 RepID=A0A6M7UCJ2_9HYPH|nr:MULTISPECIES: metalloregulator ArsR/SmtB family transcription factor [Mesorhizobium]OBQ63390.1 transcriptional regulator [Mesorhizobium loti]QKC74945.1 ArsR family transcriptional regulator [Mesorhizobium erdmanii]
MATDALSLTLAALADPTRRAILARLSLGEASVTELAEPFAMSGPAVSKHLKVLERAGLVARGRDAQFRPRRLQPEPLREVDAWLESYRVLWNARFDRIETYLQALQKGDPDGSHN